MKHQLEFFKKYSKSGDCLVRENERLTSFILGIQFFSFQKVLSFKNDSLIMFQMLFQIFFFKIFKQVFQFKLINLSNLFSFKLLDKTISMLKKLTIRKLQIYYFTELSEILLSAGFTKNLFFLTKWYKLLVEKHGLRLFYQGRKYLKNIFFNFFWKLRHYMSLKGFFLKFKGKFYKGGGKKKQVIYKYGETSFTNKNLRLVYKKLYIRTISGVVGLTIKVSY